VLIVVVVLVGIIAWLAWQPQSWYSPPDYTQPDVVKLADRAEYRLNEEFHKVRSDDEIWRLRIGEGAMNAWLSGRLEDWLTHDQALALPPEIHEPQVHVDEEGIWIAAMIEIEGGSPRPLALHLHVWIENVLVQVEPIGVRLGRIPVPLSLFEAAAESLKEESQGFKAIVPLMDAREVEIVAIEYELGAVVLTCQTKLP